LAEQGTVLEVTGLDAHYGEMQALRRVGLQARSGSVLALLGRNGAGKSTCINAITGLLSASGGRVVLDGKDLTGATPVDICRAGVGLVPQGRRVFRSLTVHENLIVAARSSPTAKAFDATAIYALFPRLAERRRSFAGTLSGGEQQMLAIGRALMGNPSVLLLDEPSEGLAPQIVAEVAACVERLRGDGMAIVLVEQNLRIAERLADRVVVLATGEVVYAGSAAEFAANTELVEIHLGVRQSEREVA